MTLTLVPCDEYAYKNMSTVNVTVIRKSSLKLIQEQITLGCLKWKGRKIYLPHEQLHIMEIGCLRFQVIWLKASEESYRRR